MRPPHGVETYLITRYDDARSALADPRFSKDMRGALETYRRIFGDSSVALDDNMLFCDPPKHTRLRRIINGVFTPRRIESLRPRIQGIADTLLDQCDVNSPVDLLRSFAFPLPLDVICELLGIAEDERTQAHAWSSVVAGTGFDAEAKKALKQAEENLHSFLKELIARKRADPADDLMSALVKAHDQDGDLTDHELVSTAWILLFAGHKTTAYMIGNSVYHLLSQPDQLAAVTRNPDLLPQVVEELLRYESSVESSTFRFASEDVKMRDVVIPKGALVQVSITSANRDPEMFRNPDSLDVERSGSQAPHLSFGHGPHYCLGASLARLEMQIALETLFRRHPGIRLAGPADEVQWLKVPFPAFRGLTTLPVLLDGPR
jgi:cytochrome P450